MSDYIFSDKCLIPDDYLIKVCLYRQKSACCRYIIWSLEDKKFYCGKLNEKNKDIIDKLADSMIAKSDNCPGTG